MSDRQQVEVDEHEEILERVAAIDVAKASGMVCTRVPHATRAGKRVTKVWQVPSTRRVHKCVHAACRYSCTRPPRRSRRWTRGGRPILVSASPTAGSGGCSPSARCARWAL